MSDADLRTLALELHVLTGRMLEKLPGEPPPPAEAPAYLDAAGLAKHFGISLRKVRDLLKKGLPKKRIGRSVRIPVCEASAWIDLHGKR